MQPTTKHVTTRVFAKKQLNKMLTHSFGINNEDTHEFRGSDETIESSSGSIGEN